MLFVVIFMSQIFSLYILDSQCDESLQNHLS